MGKNRMRALPALAFFGGTFLICLTPWGIRNQIVFGKPVLTTTLGGYNLLRHNFGIENNNYRLRDKKDFDPVARKAITEAGYDLKNMNEVQMDEVFTRAALRIIRRYPWRYLKFCVIRAGWLWYKVHGEKPPYLLQNGIVYLFMFPGLILALMRRHFLSVFVLHIFYFVLFHAAINAQFRFICPMMPYGIMIAVYAAASLWKWFSLPLAKDRTP